MTAATSFTPEVLDNYDRFCRFFTDNQAIENIRKEAENPALQSKGNLTNRWRVAALTVAAPFQSIYAVFTRAIANLLFAIGLRTWALQVFVNCRLWEKDWRLATCQIFGDKTLAFMTNERAQNSWDVYLQTDRPVETIGSKKVQDLIDPRIAKLSFYNEIGCCRGMSEWFLHLYFKTRHLFTDPEAHLRAVGRQFENGAPREAVLLQALCHHDRSFLGLEREGRRLDVQAASSDDGNQRKLIKLFKKIEPGAYAVGTGSHRMNYIALGRKRGYFFDPTHGIIAIKGAKDIAKLADKILVYTKASDPALLELEKIVPA